MGWWASESGKTGGRGQSGGTKGRAALECIAAAMPHSAHGESRPHSRAQPGGAHSGLQNSGRQRLLPRQGCAGHVLRRPAYLPRAPLPVHASPLPPRHPPLPPTCAPLSMKALRGKPFTSIFT